MRRSARRVCSKYKACLWHVLMSYCSPEMSFDYNMERLTWHLQLETFSVLWFCSSNLFIWHYRCRGACSICIIEIYLTDWKLQRYKCNSEIRVIFCGNSVRYFLINYFVVSTLRRCKKRERIVSSVILSIRLALIVYVEDKIVSSFSSVLLCVN